MRYHIMLTWDPEVFVWAASSPDIPGLVLEDSSQENLREQVRLSVPELLEQNRQEPCDDLVFHYHGPNCR